MDNLIAAEHRAVAEGYKRAAAYWEAQGRDDIAAYWRRMALSRLSAMYLTVAEGNRRHG